MLFIFINKNDNVSGAYSLDDITVTYREYSQGDYSGEYSKEG